MKSRVRSFARFAVAAVLATVGLNASAMVIFSQTFNAADMEANEVTTRATVLGPGDAFLDVLARTGTGRDKLIEFDLSSVALPTDGIVTVSFSLDATARSADNDLAVVLSDGTNMVGFMRSDNGGGQGLLWEGTDTSASGYTIDSATAILPSPASFPQVFSGEIELGLTETLVSGTLGANSASGTANLLVDRAGLQNIVIAADGTNESYRLNSLTVSISVTDVPEPGSLALLGLGLVGLSLRCKKASV